MEMNAICDALQTKTPVGWVKPTLNTQIWSNASTKKRGFHPPYTVCFPQILVAAFFLLTGALYPAHVVAQVSSLKPTDNTLAPMYEISSSTVTHFAAAVGYVFSLSDTDKYFSDKMSEINFIFVSKPSAIVSGKIDLSNLKMFQGKAKLDLAKFNADSDECFVQPIVMEDHQKIILVINSSENGPEEIDKKCFLLGLAFFDNYSANEIENLNTLNLNDMTMAILNRSVTEVEPAP